MTRVLKTHRRPPILSICPNLACPSGVTFPKQLWPFAYLLETSLGFSSTHRRKARLPPPPQTGTKTLHEGSLSSLVLSSWAQTLQPHCSPRAWCFSLHISAHAVPSAGNAFPFPSPWQTCTPPIKSIWEAGSKVNWAGNLPRSQCPSCPWNAPSLTHILSQNIHQFMGLAPHWMEGCSSLSPVPSTEFGDDSGN